MASHNQVPIRVDFQTDIVSLDDETQTVGMVLTPDPRRYETITKDGTTFYRDKYFDLYFDINTLASAHQKTTGLPGYFVPPHINNSLEYSGQRLEALKTELTDGEYVAPGGSASPHQPISDDDNNHLISFLSVDICDSTKLRAKDSQKYDKAYKIFIRELGTVVGQFHGSIFKLTGDGFIAFLDHPSKNTQCDNTIDMGLTFLALLSSGINPALKKDGLPTFSIRVGGDFGLAEVDTFSVEATGFSQTDIQSDALNRAVKIQEKAEKNKFYIGYHLYEGIHVQWLERSTLINMPSSEDLGLPDYKIYEVN